MSTETAPDGNAEAGPAPYLPIGWSVVTLVVVALCLPQDPTLLVCRPTVVGRPSGFMLGGTVGSIGIHVRKKDTASASEVRSEPAVWASSAWGPWSRS